MAPVTRERVQEALDSGGAGQLTQVELAVLHRRYGLGPFASGARTLEETAHELHLRPDQVQTLEYVAVRSLLEHSGSVTWQREVPW